MYIRQMAAMAVCFSQLSCTSKLASSTPKIYQSIPKMASSAHLVVGLFIVLFVSLSSCDHPKKCIDGDDFHVFIQFDSITPVPCDDRTCMWRAIGFYPSSSWGAIFSHSGELRDDSNVRCVRWNSMTTPNQGEIVDVLVSKGWGSAPYNLLAGAKLCGPTTSYCGLCPEFDECYPLTMNVCWTFACAYACQVGASASSFIDEPAVPNEWTCRPENYGAGDGCHCNCGAWDPDCSTGDDLSAVGCPADHVCLPPGDVCMARHDYLAQRKNIARTQGMNVHELNETWVSSDAAYDPVLFSYGKSHSHKSGKAASSAPAGWTCPTAYYDNADGCDCGCGVWDPDCDDGYQPVTNCDIDTNLHLQRRYDGGFGISYTCERKSQTCIKSISVVPSDEGWGAWKIAAVVLSCVMGAAIVLGVVIAVRKRS